MTFGKVLARPLAATRGWRGRGDNVLDSIASACAAVIAGRPPAILEPDFVERIAPVVPEEVLMKSGVEMIPGEDFVFFSMPVGEELDVKTMVLHLSLIHI